MFKSKLSAELTFISRGSEIRGDLKASGSLRIDGTVLGAVEVEGDLEVSPDGRIEGPTVRANNILVQGTVRGRVVAAGKLTLSKVARLEGDVQAGALDIAAGAVYLGHIETRDARATLASARPAELPPTVEAPALALPAENP